MKRYRSFTVVELLVVMLLAAILSILIGGALVNLSQYRRFLNRRSLPIKELGRLHYLLERDNFNAAEVTFDTDSLIFTKDTSTVAYLSFPTRTIRVQGPVADTFDYVLTKESNLLEESNTSDLLSIRLTSTDTLARENGRSSILVSLPQWQSSTQAYNQRQNEYQ